MKKEEKWTPHIIAAMAFVVFIVLGLACASAPPAQAKLGQTLEETLGKTLPELEELLGKTPAELRNIIGRNLESDGNLLSISNYPVDGVIAFFNIKDEKCNLLMFRFIGQEALNTLVQQTNEKLGNSVQVDLNTGRTHVWSYKYEDGISITMPATLRSGNAYWQMRDTKN